MIPWGKMCEGRAKASGTAEEMTVTDITGKKTILKKSLLNLFFFFFKHEIDFCPSPSVYHGARRSSFLNKCSHLSLEMLYLDYCLLTEE